MARNRYEYGTSPYKFEPEVTRTSQNEKSKLKVLEDIPRQEIKLTKEQLKNRNKITLIVVAIFAILLTISYRNSQINEKFSEVQALKRELASIEKENEQLKVNIENSLNLNIIEKQAKEKLGMQKLTNRQTVYVNLPKKDYIETASEEVVIEKEKNWFEQILEKVFGRD